MLREPGGTVSLTIENCPDILNVIAACAFSKAAVTNWATLIGQSESLRSTAARSLRWSFTWH